MNVHLEPYSDIVNLVFRWDDGSNDDKAPIILALRQYDVQEITRAISAILAFAEIDVRFNAIDALPLLVPHDVMVGLLIPSLSDPSPDIRWTVCELFHECPDSRVVLPLVKVLEDDEDPDVRLVAVEALHAVGDERAIPALAYAETHDKGRDYEDRTIAITAYEAMAAIKKRLNSQ